MPKDTDFDPDVESSKSYESLAGGGTLFSLPMGKQWTNHRRLLYPVFNSTGNLKDVSPIFASHSLRFCDKLRELIQSDFSNNLLTSRWGKSTNRI